MKKCNNCGTMLEDNENFCNECGSTVVDKLPEQSQSVSAQTNEPKGFANGNILLGIIGAILFSLIGAAIYFVIYQLGIIAGICGLAIFYLSYFGYGLFAKTNKKASIVGLVVSVILTIVMILVAEYASISYVIYNELKGFGMTFAEAIKLTPDFIAEADIGAEVAGDLAFAYIFGFIAIISNIMTIVKNNKKQQ